jgi:diacylglycerol kinase (ATP)
MRIHFFFGFFVLLLGVYLGLSQLEWVIVCTVISLVFAMEVFNTALEEIADLVKPSAHPQIRMIKHVAAAAVLILALNALVVGFFIFSNHWSWPLERMAMSLKHTDWNVLLIALLSSVFLVISGKAFFRKGTPFRGGAVSGHSAVAFSLWTTVLFTQSNIFVVWVTFLLAALVAQSRLRAKIHSMKEVIAGAVLGFLVTALLFQIFQRG